MTHFDADHWEGLLQVVGSAPVGVGGVPSHLPIFFPAVPFDVNPRLPAAVMTLITTRSPFGVQALDLRAAWQRVAPVELVPLARGDSFSLAGRRYEVVWPPAHLRVRTQRLNRLVQRIEDEAERLARNGYPQLQKSLREAYKNGPFNRHPIRDEHTAADLPDFGRLGREAEEKGEEPQDLLPDDAANPAIPREWARDPDFRKLVENARAAQNELSLIFHDPKRASLLVFGDAPRGVVKRVRNDLLACGYQVALAPHHGSRRLPNSAPCAETCVSQSGPQLRPYWRNHTSSHLNCGDCLHTHDSGDIVRHLRS